MFEIFKEFRFEAAHSLHDSEHAGRRYTRLHGHSYRAQVFVRGKRAPEGWVMDLGALEALLGAVRDELDHHFLNEIPDLGAPTLENLAHFIWTRLAPSAPGLCRVIVHRDSCGEGCVYHGPGDSAADMEASAHAYA